MAVEIGQQAPDFTSWICDGEKFQPFKFSEHLGKENVILAFYPFAFSGVCTKEFCQFRDDLDQFTQHNAKIFGISIDSPFVLNAFIKEHKLTSKQLSDFNKQISKAFGVFYEDVGGFKGVAKRSLFVLDKSGKVRYRWVTEDPKVMPDFAEVHKVLKTLQG